MFMPEYLATVRTILKGAGSRLLKWTPAKGTGDSVDVFTVLLNEPPYRDWFSSSRAMLSGHLFNPAVIDELLAQAKAGSCRYVNTFGRVVGQELALRWVHH